MTRIGVPFFCEDRAISTTLFDAYNRPLPDAATRYDYKSEDERFWRALGATDISTSGERISHTTAMKVATFFACVRNIAEDIAKLPEHVRQRQPEGSRDARDHPVQLMLDNPNPEMSKHTAIETLVAHAVAGLDGYAEVVYRQGVPVEYYPIDPTTVEMKRYPDGGIYYQVRTADRYVEIESGYMLHIKGLGYDGLTGYDMSKICNQVLGAARALDKFRGSFFGNSATPSGVLKHSSILSPDAQARLRETFENRYSGSENAHRVMVLEEGMDYAQVSIDPERAQMDTLTTLTGYDICRAFRMPPHKVGYLDNATFSNIEEQNIEYVTDVIDGWRDRLVSEFNRKLFTPEERADGYYIDVSLKGMLRGDMATRAAFMKELYYMGAINADEIRQLEEMNPTGTPNGKRYFVQQNMIPLDIAGQLAEQEAEAADNVQPDPEPQDDSEERIRESYRRILENRIQNNILRIEHDKVRRDKAGDDFYERHERYVADQLQPSIEAICFGLQLNINTDQIAADYAHLHVGVSQSTANTDRVSEWMDGTRAAVAAQTILKAIEKATNEDKDHGK